MNIKHNNLMQKKNAILVTEFDRYVMEHPEFASKISKNAQIVLQVDDDPVRSRLIRPVVQKIA